MLAFGRTGIELALRVFFVAMATGAGFIIFRCLRPSFGPWPSLLASAVPLLAPPYNILALSYNTGAIMAFMVATALAFAAVRDGNRAAAAGAGAAFALGAVPYPPLAIGALVGLGSFAVVARGRRLALWMLAGGLAVAAVVLAWLIAVGAIGALSTALAYSAAVSGGSLQTPLQKLWLFLPFVVQPFTRPSAWPAWLLAVVALLPLRPQWIRAAALGLIPLAVALPALRYASSGQGHIDVIGAVMLITLSGIVFLPVAAWMIAEPHRDLRLLLQLALPLALVDLGVVIYSTNAGWSRGTGFTGVAPLAMAIIVSWALFTQEKGGRAVFAASAASLIAVVVVMLFATAFNSDPPLVLRTPIATGAYAGLLTTGKQAQTLAAIEAAGRRWVGPEDSVLVVQAPGVYLLLPGRIDTNAVWLVNGYSDRYALDYFARRKDMPRVVVESVDLRPHTGALAYDPLQEVLSTDYRVVDEAARYRFYLRR